jgi:hypothetical protein
MKNFLILLLPLVLLTCQVSAQDLEKSITNSTSHRQLTVEPALGIHTNFGIDLLITNLVQWNLTKHLSLAAHSSYNLNNSTQRNFNYVKTDYNYSLNQKFGIGRTIYSRKSSHSFMFMVGVKYTEYKETLNNPDFDKVGVSIGSWSPDYGLMYSLKKGLKKCFFSFRMYVPLYPWPTKGFNIQYVDGNLHNIALEFGVGIKIK